MKKLLLASILILGVSAKAQTAPSDPATLAAAAAQSLPSGVWAGKLDKTWDASIGAWQSVKSADQAIGVSKRVFHLDKGDQPLLNLGLFAGASKPVFLSFAQPIKFLGGATVAVPGSTLDWALGTNWGAQWAPKLKTGILCAYDLTRAKQLKAVPDFIGLGAAWPFGNGL